MGALAHPRRKSNDACPPPKLLRASLFGSQPFPSCWPTDGRWTAKQSELATLMLSNVSLWHSVGSAALIAAQLAVCCISLIVTWLAKARLSEFAPGRWHSCKHMGLLSGGECGADVLPSCVASNESSSQTVERQRPLRPQLGSGCRA